MTTDRYISKLHSTTEKAKEIIDRERFVKICLAGAELILKTLDRPPQPNAALVSLFDQDITTKGKYEYI